MEISQIAEKALKKSKELGAKDTAVSVSSLEAKEFNVESGKMTLLRTTFDQNLSVKTILQNRQASVLGNQFSDEGISEVTKKSLQAAEAASEITGAGFAENQGQHQFEYGADPIHEEWIYEQLQNVLTETKQKYPKVIINGATIKFIKAHAETMTSKGSHLISKQNYYEGFVMFNSKDGNKSSSFNYIGFAIGADGVLKTPGLMKTNGLSELLRQSEEQLNVRKAPEKFVGEVIVTPHCMEQFLPGLLSYVGSGQMMKKTTPLFGKKNERVISEKLTVEAAPRGSQFSTKAFWNSDGYLSQNEVIFEKGILKSYLLNHQAATQLQEKVSLSGGSHLQIQKGSTPLKDMFKNVKKGVLLCRYSAGNPAENGDVSGVAKNSYYIENGEILFPLGETMVAMNLFEAFRNVPAVSVETLNSGYSDFPWVQMSGASVS